MIITISPSVAPDCLCGKQQLTTLQTDADVPGGIDELPEKFEPIECSAICQCAKEHKFRVQKDATTSTPKLKLL